MTVETSARKQSFAGGQSVLTFTFKCLPAFPQYIQAYVVSSGTQTALTYSTDYTVSLNSDGVGGTVTVTPTYSTNYTYTVYRETTALQESDYNDYNQFPANTVETDFDRGISINQEQAEDIDRSLKASISSGISGLELPIAEAGKGIKWNPSATSLVATTYNVDEQAAEAALYATTASTQAALASTYASTASTQATLSGNYASTASTQATLSENYASTSSTQAALAENYASTASTQAALAGNYASTASTQATDASNYATTASTASASAAANANSASASAASSNNYASTASTAATDASNYATTASNAATDAENYATTASTAAATVPDPTGETIGDYIRVNSSQDGWDFSSGSGVADDGSVNPTNIISNGDFESWSAGTSSAPDGWILTGAGASVARESSTVKKGTYSCALTRAGADVILSNNITWDTYYRERTVTVGGWVWASVANRAKIGLKTNIGGFTGSSFHSGGSTWEWLTVSLDITAGVGAFYTSCQLFTGDTTAYFDGIMCVEGASSFAFSPKPPAFGDWTAARTAGSIYLAVTDGFVLAYSDGTGAFNMLTDSSNPPTTIRQIGKESANYNSLMCPVKNGDYYTVTGTTSAIFWMPIAT